jgi:hypothetical protein
MVACKRGHFELLIIQKVRMTLIRMNMLPIQIVSLLVFRKKALYTTLPVAIVKPFPPEVLAVCPQAHDHNDQSVQANFCQNRHL